MCHAAVRRSVWRFVGDHLGGAAYVFLNYGGHWLLNVEVKGDSGARFMLFCALEPCSGMGD